MSPEDIRAAEMPADAVRVETPFQRFWSEFRESRIALLALLVLALIVVLALLAPWITPQDPYDLAQVDVLDGKLPPGSEAFAGYTMWLGSDGAGRAVDHLGSTDPWLPNDRNSRARYASSCRACSRGCSMSPRLLVRHRPRVRPMTLPSGLPSGHNLAASS